MSLKLTCTYISCRYSNHALKQTHLGKRASSYGRSFTPELICFLCVCKAEMNKFCGEKSFKGIVKNYSEALFQWEWPTSSARDWMRDEGLPMRTRRAKLSRATNCISILVHPQFHARAFKITSIGEVWVLSTQTQYLFMKMNGTRDSKQALHHARRIHRVYKSPVISQIKGAFVQQKLQLICPEITGSELWLCAPLQLVLVKMLERKRGKMEHMAGAKKEDREDLVSNTENQHACPLFFFFFWRWKRTAWLLWAVVHMQNVIMEKLSGPEVFTERLNCCLAYDNMKAVQ